MRARFKSLYTVFLSRNFIGREVLTCFVVTGAFDAILVQDDGGNVRLFLEMLPRMLS